MSHAVKVSVVIPVFNGALLIERCLHSVYQQNGDYQLEVIVIDDGSTDHSIALVNAYSETITLIEQTNQGPAAARNKGLERATGSYVAFLDADDYWDPNFLKHTVGFMETHKVVAVSVGQIHKITGKSDRVMPQLDDTKDKTNTNGVVLDDFYDFWAAHNHVCTGSVLMRTQIAKQTGGQRPELRITEDLEFWGYLATFGAWGFIPKVLFVSDGGLVTKSQGWLQKNRKRWQSAPTVEDWEARIIKNIKPKDRTSFEKVKGRIAKNLAYAMIMSNRYEQARQTTLAYGQHYPKDKIAWLLTACAPHHWLWVVLAKGLGLREQLK